MVNAVKVALFIAFLLARGVANAADDVASAWAALRGDGHVALIRHASAPGPAGDPAGYKLDDCATQRNLSEQGRAEARLPRRALPHAAGQDRQDRQLSVVPGRQTAELMNIGPVEDAPTFNNAFVLNARRDALTAGARATIDAWRGPGTLVVVTHGQNILLMLGFHPREGEIIAAAPDPASENKMRTDWPDWAVVSDQVVATRFRFGSKADMCSAKRQVRFTPESGHSRAR